MVKIIFFVLLLSFSPNFLQISIFFVDRKPHCIKLRRTKSKHVWVSAATFLRCPSGSLCWWLSRCSHQRMPLSVWPLRYAMSPGKAGSELVLVWFSQCFHGNKSQSGMRPSGILLGRVPFLRQEETRGGLFNTD